MQAVGHEHETRHWRPHLCTAPPFYHPIFFLRQPAFHPPPNPAAFILFADSAGIAKLDDGNIVLEPRTSRSSASPSPSGTGGRGVVIPEPLEVRELLSVAWSKVLLSS